MYLRNCHKQLFANRIIIAAILKSKRLIIFRRGEVNFDLDHDLLLRDLSFISGGEGH